jgi:hypothetical protein
MTHYLIQRRGNVPCTVTSVSRTAKHFVITVSVCHKAHSLVTCIQCSMLMKRTLLVQHSSFGGFIKWRDVVLLFVSRSGRARSFVCRVSLFCVIRIMTLDMYMLVIGLIFLDRKFADVKQHKS